VREWKIRFGTAGTSDSFAAQGYKNSLDIPAYTARMGLNAFEYQCGRGVRLGLDKARQMAADAAAQDILFSVHAPYYISMSSLEEDKRLNSVNYLLQSAAVCKALGGQRVIFHSGSCGRQSREAALEKALDTLRRAQAALDEAGFSDITLCPETMGKIGQLGTLDEVLALCRVDRRITPCIDFGHLNARTLGGIASKADYAAILDRMEEALGDARARRFQVHFSRIEYTAGRDPVRPGAAAADGAVGGAQARTRHHLRKRRDTGGGCADDGGDVWKGEPSPSALTRCHLSQGERHWQAGVGPAGCLGQCDGKPAGLAATASCCWQGEQGPAAGEPQGDNARTFPVCQRLPHWGSCHRR